MASENLPLDDESPSSERSSVGRSFFSRIFKSLLILRESRIGMLGAALILFWIIVALIAPFLPIRDPNLPMTPFVGIWESDAEGNLFILGTDNRGRDILSRLIWGSQRILFWSVTATAAAYVVGMTLGVVSGYLRGWWDEVISFIVNVLLSFPVLVLYLIIVISLPAELRGVVVIIAVSVASGPGISRIVRGLVLDLRNRDYIAAAQTRGESNWRIMVFEILPNARGPLIVDSCLRLGYTTITISLLGFLGIGLPPPDPDWGQMIKEALDVGPLAGHTAWLPAVALSSLVLGFNLLADGLREISLRD